MRRIEETYENDGFFVREIVRYTIGGREVTFKRPPLYPRRAEVRSDGRFVYSPYGAFFRPEEGRCPDTLPGWEEWNQYAELFKSVGAGDQNFGLPGERRIDKWVKGAVPVGFRTYDDGRMGLLSLVYTVGEDRDFGSVQNGWDNRVETEGLVTSMWIPRIGVVHTIPTQTDDRDLQISRLLGAKELRSDERERQRIAELQGTIAAKIGEWKWVLNRLSSYE